MAEKEGVATTTKGSVLSKLLPIVDAFDSASTQIKPANEGEQKIHNSYQVLIIQIMLAKHQD